MPNGTPHFYYIAFYCSLFWNMCIYLDIATTKKLNKYNYLTCHIWTPVPSFWGGGGAEKHINSKRHDEL